jgi:hypothetical protein
VSKFPEDGRLVSKRFGVIKVSNVVYAVCAFCWFSKKELGDYNAWSKPFHKHLPSGNTSGLPFNQQQFKPNFGQVSPLFA